MSATVIQSVFQPLMARVGAAWPMRWSARRARAWPDQLDFRPAPMRPAPWAWALLAAGLLSVLWLADQAGRLQQRQDEAQAQIRRLSQADRRLRVARAAHAPRDHAPSRAPSVVASAPTLDPAGADEAVAMVRALAFPWPALMQRMERSASAAGAVMLSMGTSLDETGRSPGPTWRLQAAVRDDASALAWAADLPAGRLVSRASLTMPINTTQGPYGLKAELQAQTPWDELAALAASTGPDSPASPADQAWPAEVTP